MASGAKKLFLVDAMAHVYRAFFAPMPQRLTGPNGAPTNVPFLFGNILKRLIKDYDPKYIGVVFDPPGATFRDKLFEKYKAQRQPMPDDMRVQIPLVRRLCEAMRLPVLEERGYEADDVIGTIATQAGKQGFEVLIVSNDKDMMQLVGKNVRTLKTGSGGAKGDILVDEAKVQELLGVPAEKVVDYMALLGDTVDNIPGAKGIGEKGAAELIAKYGSVETALDHADEVSNKRYREALQQQRDQVLMSKQLATISTDVPMKLDFEALERREPDLPALAALYRELGFSSLLKELGAGAVGEASTGAVSAAGEDLAHGSRGLKFLQNPARDGRSGQTKRARRSKRSCRCSGTPSGPRSFTTRKSFPCWPVKQKTSSMPPSSIPTCCGPPPRTTTSPTWSCASSTSCSAAAPESAPTICSGLRRCSTSR